MFHSFKEAAPQSKGVSKMLKDQSSLPVVMGIKTQLLKDSIALLNFREIVSEKNKV